MQRIITSALSICCLFVALFARPISACTPNWRTPQPPQSPPRKTNKQIINNRRAPVSMVAMADAHVSAKNYSTTIITTTISTDSDDVSSVASSLSTDAAAGCCDASTRRRPRRPRRRRGDSEKRRRANAFADFAPLGFAPEYFHSWRDGESTRTPNRRVAREPAANRFGKYACRRRRLASHSIRPQKMPVILGTPNTHTQALARANISLISFN